MADPVRVLFKRFDQWLAHHCRVIQIELQGKVGVIGPVDDVDDSVRGTQKETGPVDIVNGFHDDGNADFGEDRRGMTKIVREGIFGSFIVDGGCAGQNIHIQGTKPPRVFRGEQDAFAEIFNPVGQGTVSFAAVDEIAAGHVDHGHRKGISAYFCGKCLVFQLVGKLDLDGPKSCFRCRPRPVDKAVFPEHGGQIGGKFVHSAIPVFFTS
jgi:hypothetical protein